MIVAWITVAMIGEWIAIWIIMATGEWIAIAAIAELDTAGIAVPNGTTTTVFVAVIKRRSDQDLQPDGRRPPTREGRRSLLGQRQIWVCSSGVFRTRGNASASRMPGWAGIVAGVSEEKVGGRRMLDDRGPAAPRGRWVFGILICLGVAAIAALMPATFPWGVFAHRATPALSQMVGRKVSIGSARRTDFLSFTPSVELSDVRIAQPEWADGEDFARIHHLTVRFRVWALLLGRFQPESVIADGLVLRLHRYADGRENWVDRKHRPLIGPVLHLLTVRDSRIELRNDNRQVLLAASIAVDPQRGLSVLGDGTHRNQPVHVEVRGPPVTAAAIGKPYPTTVSIRSAILTFEATGHLDQPLDLDHYDARIRTSGRNLLHLDDIIQAGLFETQPFRLTADIRHQAPDWIIRSLRGTVGRSLLSASGTVRAVPGHTSVALRVDADRLDFDDLASDKQRAEARKRIARLGQEFYPMSGYSSIGSPSWTVRSGCAYGNCWCRPAPPFARSMPISRLIAAD